MAWTTSDLPIVCERTGTAHVLSLALPVRYRSLERAPLLFCLDGPWMFGTTVDATRLMSMSSEAPEAAVVGLSFDVDSMGEYLRQRARWFTPTPWVPPTITGVRGVTADECGRADELLRFIEDQALPAAEARLAEHVEPSERWLIGHSFSALFGLTALFRGQTRFDKWLLASPSIWWDDRAVLAIEAAHAAANDDLRAAVFACYGEQELEPSDTTFRTGMNVEELAERLHHRRYPGLRLSHAMLRGDGHASSVGAAISNGLRALG